MIGGGVSGLVCGHALKKAGIDVLVVDAAPHPGGVIESELQDGFLIERGPQSFSGTPQLSALCDELGLRDETVLAPASAPRYVLINGSRRGGSLRRVPSNPVEFFASPLFSAKTKWSVLRDAKGKSQPPNEDESVADFVLRKFTPQLLEQLVGPFVSGIFAGDPEKLSLAAAFPQIYEAEKNAGSVIRGLLKQRKEGRRTLQSFRRGNVVLTRTIAEKLGGSLRLGTQAIEIRKQNGGYIVRVITNGQPEEIQTEHLICATPAKASQQLLSQIDPEFAKTFSAMEYAAVAVVSLGYRIEDVGHSLEGFGFLAPRAAGLRILGTVWNSSLFAGRAPTGHILVTSFVGGVLDPDAASLSASELTSLVHSEIAGILNIKQRPVFSSVTAWPPAIPQYNLGHGERLRSLELLRERHAGLWLTGNYLNGPSIGGCVQHALLVASNVRNALQRIE